jgi:RHS repeat-associated protein
VITYTYANLQDARKTRRYVTSRTESLNGVSSTWNFSVTVQGISDYNADVYTATVTYPPVGNPPVANQSVFVSSEAGISDAKIYAGSAQGTPLREYQIGIVTDSDPYADDACYNEGGNIVPPLVPQAVGQRVAFITTILENGLQSQKQFDYETFTYVYHPNHCTFKLAGQDSNVAVTYTTSRGNVSEIREYDWGQGAPGPLIRRTDKTYLHNSNSNYLSRNIVDKVLQETVYDNTTNTCKGVSQPCAQTQYEFDNYVAGQNALISTSSNQAPQHDYPNYPSTFIYRGNATRVKKWRNTDGALLATTYTYDDLGNIRAVQDPLGYTASYSYTDSWANTYCPPSSGSGQAYVTQFTNPLSQQVRFKYFPCTGLTQSRQDQNDMNAARVGTTYTFDLLGRITQRNLPDGGQVATAYADVPPVSSTSTTKITSSLNLITTSKLDSLGRPIQSQLNSDPDPAGVIYTDSTYDALGRKSTLSNPHRSASLPTDGITTSVYDALNRVTMIIPPDGTRSANNVSTIYSGNCTTVTDEAGKNRKSCSDGLGRLTQVFEDPAGLNYETDYTYDALNNLLTVNQKGGSTNSANWRTRTFTYNSLSQLLTAANPESGTVSYTYDDNGNLQTKKDARTITITYSYDPLNRLTGKTYSNGDPPVSYTYDQSSCLGLTVCDNIGKRTGMIDAAGSEAWSFGVANPAQVDQRTITSSPSNISKTTTYTYNLDGSHATIAYPSGRVITYTVAASGTNTAGRMASAVDSTGPINYATSALYSPAGALSSFTNGGSIVSTLYYNDRLQPCRISVKSSGTAPAACTDTATGNILDFNYNFSLGASDNGNLMGITNNRDTTRSQNFLYDSLNRVSVGETTSTFATSSAHCWEEQFSYDPWGNLSAIGGASPAYTGCTQEALSVTPATNNQISGFCYDAAGNLLAQSAPPCPFPTYAYNAENQMTTSMGVTYLYDGDGKRVKKSTGKLYWFGMGSDPLDETDAAGNTNNVSFNEFIFFGGKRIARRDSSNNIVYYFADHLGTARIIANSSGTILDESDFYPFGDERAMTSSSGNNYKFTGKERDPESGLDNFTARYMTSSMGRFVSADPITVTPGRMADPQQLNLYSYVKNNPLAFTDPTGMIIDTSDLSDKDKKLWQKVVDLANQQDANGNYVNATLHDAYSRLDGDSRVFKIEDDKSLGQSEAGRFEITKFNGPNDFSEAKVELNFGAIKGISSTTKGDFDSSFNKYEGLFGKNGFINRLAETFGHEAGGHGLFALQDPAFAVYTQKLLNDVTPAILAANRARTPLPPDLQQKVQQKDLVLIPSERFAQQQEKIVNGELRATHP